ncbi:uncharacterized protein LOC135095506 [Scylla paramamosain]|uniref:uncharacterized protein LOC135095506 n=1 Tax=Scylla paramamosain TaxID=85552 RepID=UPI0030838228
MGCVFDGLPYPAESLRCGTQAELSLFCSSFLCLLLMMYFMCVDDTLLYDNSIEEAFWHTYDFLATCASKDITLKPEKFQFAQREVNFVGFCLEWDEYKPTDERLATVKSFKMPEKPSISDIRSWYRFVNQRAPFLATAPIMNDFRELLRKTHWENCVLGRTTEEVSSSSGHQMPTRPGRPCILQQHTAHSSHHRLEQGGHRIRHTAAVLSLFFRCRPFLLQVGVALGFVRQPPPHRHRGRLRCCGRRNVGCSVVSPKSQAVPARVSKPHHHHRPSPAHETFRGQSSFTEVINPRLFRLKERTLQYHFQVKYLHGKRNPVADFLSRYLALRSPQANTNADLEEDLDQAFAAAVIAAVGHEGHILDESIVKQFAANDPVYQLLLAKVSAGDWHQHKSQACLRPFFGVREIG